MILGAKMDMEYTFHLPKITVSLNKLTWSENASSYRVTLPQQAIVFSDILLPEIMNCGLADSIGNGFRVSWVSDVDQGEVSVVGTQDYILDPVQLWWRHTGWTSSISLSRFTLHLPFPTLFPARLAFLGCFNSPHSSGFSLVLANGKLWWIFLFSDLPFRDLCSFSVDRLLQCWLPHHLRYPLFGLRMPMTYLDSHSLIPYR